MSPTVSDITSPPLPELNVKLFVRGLAAMTVLNGIGVGIFLGFFPLLLLGAGSLVHKSILDLTTVLVATALLGVVVSWLAIRIGLFIFWRLFSSFAWRTILALCLAGCSLVMTAWDKSNYLDVAVFCALFVLSAHGLITKQEEY